MAQYHFSFKKFCRPFVLVILFFSSPSLQAHPHSWIDLKTTFLGTETHITGFKMSWSFDAITSMYMLDGEELTDGNRARILKKVSHSVMKNINLEHYFTYFYDGDSPIKYSFSDQGVVTQHKRKLQLDFYLPLAKPELINNKVFRLLVFEPSYYVDMSWLNQKDIQLSQALNKSCSVKLIAPHPSAKLINYAMTLPAGANPDNALGQLFTQVAQITCSKVSTKK